MPAKETIEGALSDVFLVGAARPNAAQLFASQADQSRVIAFPQLLSRGFVSEAQSFQPTGDGTGGRHRAASSFLHAYSK
jgi:hypothetical protein